MFAWNGVSSMQVKGTIYGYIHIRSFGGVNLDKNNLFELDKKITNKAQHFGLNPKSWTKLKINCGE